MPSTSSSTSPLRKTNKSINSSNSIIKNKSFPNVFQKKHRKIKTSVNNINIKRHFSNKNINEKQLFKHKRNHSFNNNSFKINYNRENISKDTTKESSLLDIIEAFPKCNKKTVSFAKPFIKVIKIKSYKQYNQFHTSRQIILETNTINNKKDKVGCSCVIC